MKTKTLYTGLEIAVVGIACRFPGASNWKEFWDNLINGVESVNINSSLSHRKNCVVANATVRGKDQFDASFFGYSGEEASIMNPLHRILHECVWEAIEDASFDISKVKNEVGIFAGSSDDLNWRMNYVLKNKNEHNKIHAPNFLLSRDYLASLISYKLDFKGPAITINTACSTSLVAINMASKSLLLGEIEVGIVGAVSLNTEKDKIYYHGEGTIYSVDGHCSAFDSSASGIIVGEGAGVVILKRLDDALRDNDNIYALIKGSFVNNDGNRKVGFSAPGVNGQAECVRKAHLLAKVKPDTITYVEAHGSGTNIGDQVEVAALNKAFMKSNARCALGSVKTNIGHLGPAAGMAGLIKTILCLKEGKIPPSLHFKIPNPEIPFKHGPFYVNDKLEDWASNTGPRRAGVSAFGLGGTNAHVVLEEAPKMVDHLTSHDYHLIVVSAKSPIALKNKCHNLALFISNNSELDISNLCYSLQVGRSQFQYRKGFVCNSLNEVITELRDFETDYMYLKHHHYSPTQLNFVFHDFRNLNISCCEELSRSESSFKEHVDFCLERGGLLINQQISNEASEELENYRSSMVMDDRYAGALSRFANQYAFARLLFDWGMKPSLIIGEGLGELTAAVFSHSLGLEDAVKILFEVLKIAGDDSGMDLKMAIKENLANIKPTIPYYSNTNYSIPPDSKLLLSIQFKDAKEINVEGNVNKEPIMISFDNITSFDTKIFLNKLCEVWQYGVDIDWHKCNLYEGVRKIPLPYYPFEKKHFPAEVNPFE